jgi:FAD/FMN-containing dehydrogenase
VLFSGTTSYDNFTAAYWAAQQAIVDPSCVFKPSTTRDVSIAVLLSRLTQCPFAVKGGGHAAFAGASSIDAGITIAMENMNGITLTEDKKIAAIGPGNRWLKVYQTLEKEGVEVTGGRVSDLFPIECS